MHIRAVNTENSPTADVNTDGKAVATALADAAPGADAASGITIPDVDADTNDDSTRNDMMAINEETDGSEENTQPGPAVKADKVSKPVH